MAVNANTGLLTLYHGSKAQFVRFDMARAGANGALLDIVGVYFTQDIVMARSYGGYVYKVMIGTEDVTDITTPYKMMRYLEKVREEVGNKLCLDIDVSDMQKQAKTGTLSVFDIENAIYKKCGRAASIVHIRAMLYRMFKDFVHVVDAEYGDTYICVRGAEKLRVVQMTDAEQKQLVQQQSIEQPPFHIQRSARTV